MRHADRRRKLKAPLAALCLLASTPVSLATAQEAVDPEAAGVLANMQAYLGELESFTVKYDAEIDVITQDGEKLKFSSSGELAAERPNRLHVTRMGAVVDAEFILDGEALTIFGHNINGYIQFPAESIDEAVDALRDNTGFDAPGADLLLSKPLDASATDVVSGTHVGMAYVDGAEVHHLAFRGKSVDWQLWVQAGAEPLPVKYVITSKLLAGAPEYALRLSDWNIAPQLDAVTFTFEPLPGATALSSISVDEIGLIGREGE